MERSIPQATGAQGAPDGRLERGAPLAADRDAAREARRVAVLTALLLVLVCLTVYVCSRPIRYNTSIHFVWQAQSWLDGETTVPMAGWPAPGQPRNVVYQDVMPVYDAHGAYTGRGIIPFPPFPALVLLPFVAVWHLGTDEQLLSMLLGALDVGLAFWVLGALRIRENVRALAALFVGLGSALWYTASTGSTWYFAHVVAVACMLLSVGVALRADRRLTDEPLGSAREVAGGIVRQLARPWAALPLDGRQVLAGFLLGLAVTARLTTIFGFPFLVLVGGGGSWLRRSVSAGVGLAVPVLALLAYTRMSTGSFFNPAYDYLYHLELGYTFLGYHRDWAISDLRYVPQNLAIMLFNGPLLFPSAVEGVTACARGGFRVIWDSSCPIAIPNPVGMSVLITSPAYLLAPLGLARLRLRQVDRVAAGALLAVVAIAFVNLMHFSQGWVQFGYRFADDFMPFGILLVALGANRIRRLWPFAVLVAVSIAVNLWGVAMGAEIGW